MKRVNRLLVLILSLFLSGCTILEQSKYEILKDYKIDLLKAQNAADIELNRCQIDYVVDGDTFNCTLDSGSQIIVRMIGVDTPESVHTDSSRNTKEGKEASNFSKEYLAERVVYLEYDAEAEDIYGRTLAYVWLDLEAKEMYQYILLKEGYASLLTVEPNTKYLPLLEEYQAAAKENKVGFWGTGFFK